MDRFKIPKHTQKVNKPKLPTDVKSIDSFFGLTVSFSFQKYDGRMSWAKSDNGKPVVDDIFQNLKGFEGANWSGIISAAGGREHGTNSHYINANKLLDDARQRLIDLKIDENELFSLRVQGDVRLWGIIESDGCFDIIWYDPNHKVYSYEKKHT